MDRSTLEGHLSSDSLGDRLLLLNFATRQLEPQLAEGWEFLAPDRWRFSLRPGVSFHNGEPFDAEAAAWAIDWQGGSQERVQRHQVLPAYQYLCRGQAHNRGPLRRPLSSPA